MVEIATTVIATLSFAMEPPFVEDELFSKL